jgi:hypothetical protein
MLFELGVSLADSLTVHPGATPTTLARRGRPRPAARENQAGRGPFRGWEPRGRGCDPLSAAPARPEMSTVLVALLRKAPLTARSARTPAQRQPAFCSSSIFRKRPLRRFRFSRRRKGAEQPVQGFIRALRERTNMLKRVIEAGRFTQKEFDYVTDLGGEIDRAFSQLRADGFVSNVHTHEPPPSVDAGSPSNSARRTDWMVEVAQRCVDSRHAARVLRALQAEDALGRKP